MISISDLNNASTAAQIRAAYSALWDQLAKAGSLSQGDEILETWASSQPYQKSADGRFSTNNAARLQDIRNRIGYVLTTNNVSWPQTYEDAKINLSRIGYMANSNSETALMFLEYGARNELPAWLSEARNMWTSTRATFLQQVASQSVQLIQSVAVETKALSDNVDTLTAAVSDVADSVKTVTEETQSLSSNVQQLAGIVSQVVDSVDISEDLRAQLQSQLTALRKDREDAGARIIKVLEFTAALQQQLAALRKDRQDAGARLLQIIEQAQQLDHVITTGNIDAAAKGSQPLTTRQKLIIAGGVAGVLALLAKVLK